MIKDGREVYIYSLFIQCVRGKEFANHRLIFREGFHYEMDLFCLPKSMVISWVWINSDIAIGGSLNLNLLAIIFTILIMGFKVNSRLHGWRAGTATLPELTLSPSQGSMNSSTVFTRQIRDQFFLDLDSRMSFFRHYSFLYRTDYCTTQGYICTWFGKKGVTDWNFISGS